MNRGIVLIGLVVFFAGFIFLTGCTEKPGQPPLPQQNPTDAYNALAQKAENAAPMHLKYNFVMGLGQQAAMGLSNLNMDLEIFMLSKNKTKTLASMSLMGQSINTAIYNLGGKTIQCTEGSAMGMGKGLQCTLGQDQDMMMGMDPDTKELDEMFKDYNIEFSGEKTFAGRKSQCFLLKYNAPDLKGESQLGSLGSPQFGNYSFKQEVCLDLEKGFASYMDLKSSVYSELAGKKTSGPSLKMELTSYSPTVTEKDLELPVSFSLGNAFSGATCTSEKVELTIIPFKELSRKQATIKIGPASLEGEEPTTEQQKTMTLPQIELFKEKELEIEFSEEISAGSKQIELCIGEECQNTGCWLSSVVNEPKESIGCASVAFVIDLLNSKPTYYSDQDRVKLVLINKGEMTLSDFRLYEYYSDGSTETQTYKNQSLEKGDSIELWTIGGKGEKPERMSISSLDCTGISVEVRKSDIIEE